jgi:predicted RNA-binding protein with RPS1 domain
MCVHEYDSKVLVDGKPVCIHCGHIPSTLVPPYEDLLKENEQLKEKILDLEERLKFHTRPDSYYDF